MLFAYSSTCKLFYVSNPATSYIAEAQFLVHDWGMKQLFLPYAFTSDSDRIYQVLFSGMNVLYQYRLS
jgi:hypothetical protein